MNAIAGRLVAFGLAIAMALGALPAFAQSAPSSYTSGYRYDSAGRQTGTIAPDPDGAGPVNYAATRTTIDARGLVTRVEAGELAAWQSEAIAPASWTGFTVFQYTDFVYDQMGRKLQESVTAGAVIQRVTQYSYDADGRLDCVAERMNPAAFASLPASACTLGTQGSFGPDRITKTSYDALDHVALVQKAYGTSLQQNYATYTRDVLGKPTSVTDANGNKASMAYDIFGRQTYWYFPSKTTVGQVSTTDYEQYGYDANGNRTSLRKRDGSTITYSYDALNRNTVKVVPERAGLAATHTRDVYYGYDLRGLQTYARFDSISGEGVSYAYDGFGRLASSTLTMDGVSRTLSYLVDMNGNRTRVTHPDGNYFTYYYDGLNRATLLQRNSDNGIAAFKYNDRGLRSQLIGGSYAYYTYDPIGRLSALNHDFSGTIQDVNYSFGYNPASQITSRTISNDGYAYTGDVNVNRSYAVNGLNQYTSAGPASFTYDANGNLTGDGSSAYVYDVENRLVSASGSTTAGLRYDPLGRLYETSGGTAGITRFLYDGDELVAEYNSSGTLLRRYAHSAEADDPIVWFDGATVADSAARILKPDHQGTIIALTDWNGAVTTINTYDAYGIPGTANQGRFQYTGQAWIPELGMYYYKARIYSPTLGRFLQTDPIGYKDQINLYSYVGNDPVNREDSTGLISTCAAFIIANIGSCTDNYPDRNASVNNIAVPAAGPSVGTGVVGAVVEGAPLAATLLLAGDAAQSNRTEPRQYWQITYTKTAIVDGRTVVYSGRTSGYGNSAQEVLRRRDAGHHMAGFGPARLDRAVSTTATINREFQRWAIRGREQMLIEYFGGARSAGGTSGNAINGISIWNPARNIYLSAARLEFGETLGEGP